MRKSYITRFILAFASAVVLAVTAMPIQAAAANVQVVGGSPNSQCDSGGSFSPSPATVNSGDTVTFSVPADYPNEAGVIISGLPEGSFTLTPGTSHTTGPLTANASYSAVWPVSGCQKGGGTITVNTPPPAPAPTPAPTPAPAPQPTPAPTPAASTPGTPPHASATTKPKAATTSQTPKTDPQPAVEGASTNTPAPSPQSTETVTPWSRKNTASGLPASKNTSDNKSNILLPTIIAAIIGVVLAGTILLRKRLTRQKEPEETVMLPPKPISSSPQTWR